MPKREAMTPRERLEAVFAGHRPDHTPILGGWIACPDHICTLAGVDLAAYAQDSWNVTIEAYRQLGSDGLIGAFVPRTPEEYRCVDKDTYRRADKGISLEQAVAQIDAMPSPAEIESSFDFDAEYEKFRGEILQPQQACGQIVWMPAQWGAGSRSAWYEQFGYETYFLLIGLHPDRMVRLFQIGGAHGLNLCRVIARAVEEGIYPHALLFGEDICTQRGPMISPEFLAEHYAPTLARGIQPLLDVGCKPVWHCDGDVRPILPMLLECGVQGLQGFQPECGLNIDYVSTLRTRDGEPLVIFGPLAVTTELPVCTPDEIKAKVRHAVDVCRDNARLVLFTANTINPDVPLENILAMHEAAREG